MDFAYLFREQADSVTIDYDRHICGLFSRNQWLGGLSKVGFEPENILDPWERDVFLGKKL